MLQKGKKETFLSLERSWVCLCRSVCRIRGRKERIKEYVGVWQTNVRAFSVMFDTDTTQSEASKYNTDVDCETAA